MRFWFKNCEYAIDFVRGKGKTEYYVAGKKVFADATYPFTTVNLIALDPKERGVRGGIIYKTAIVGCLHKDVFSVEKGRVAALRKLTKELDEVAKPLVWEAHFSRFQKKYKPTPPTTPIMNGLNIREAELMNEEFAEPFVVS